MKKSLKIICVIILLIIFILFITYSYAVANTNINQSVKEKQFFEIPKLEVGKKDKVEMILNLDNVKFDEFVFELKSDEILKNIEISKNDKVETEKNDNEIIMEISKEKTNIKNINFYYSIPEGKKVGDIIKFKATITGVVKNEMLEKDKNEIEKIDNGDKKKEDKNEIIIEEKKELVGNNLKGKIEKNEQEIDTKVNTDIKSEVKLEKKVEKKTEQKVENKIEEKVEQKAEQSKAETQSIEFEVKIVEDKSENNKQEIQMPNTNNINENNKKPNNNAQTINKNNIPPSINKETTQKISNIQYIGTSSNQVIKTVTYNGSDNNYLSTLLVNGYTLNKEFSKENTTYFITVESVTEKLDIIASVEDTGAILSVYGNEKLKEGINKILISVTAENGNVRNYRIYVTKKA